MTSPQYPTAPPAPPTGETPLWAPLYGASLPQAVRRFFAKYADFSGRASRSEYWWWYLVTVIVDETDAKAQAKFEDYQQHVSYDGSLVFMSGWTGIDFDQYLPTDTVKRVETNAIVSTVAHPAARFRDIQRVKREEAAAQLGAVAEAAL